MARWVPLLLDGVFVIGFFLLLRSLRKFCPSSGFPDSLLQDGILPPKLWGDALLCYLQQRGQSMFVIEWKGKYAQCKVAIKGEGKTTVSPPYWAWVENIEGANKFSTEIEASAAIGMHFGNHDPHPMIVPIPTEVP